MDHVASNSELFKDIVMIFITLFFPPSNEFILVRRDGKEDVPVYISHYYHFSFLVVFSNT